MQNSHIDITFDLSECGIEKAYDLRIPVHISVKKLLIYVMDILKIDQKIINFAIKVKTKGIILVDDDILTDYPVSDGDILTILCRKASTIEEGAI
ncbi:EsaB/YukD family protein [Paraliobacillus sp. JSM ZJ581]|uniref:EsaB/YukD family protein n=1 Tax=Paraliobacillus sp. JSM ZJ581 TaxID=3342118 RepID=UPI0035A86A47